MWKLVNKPRIGTGVEDFNWEVKERNYFLLRYQQKTQRR